MHILKVFLIDYILSTVYKTAHNGTKIINYQMAFLFLLKTFLWILHNVVVLFSIPLIYFKSLKKREKCPPIQNKLLLLSAAEIAKRIREKQITCKEIVEAYIARIEEVNPTINAVIENRFKEALEDAEKTDLFIKTSELSQDQIKEKFPLLGVPITIKGSIAVKGLNCGAGRVDYIVKAKTDAVSVIQVKEAGAIPLLISNVPELCLNWETYNKLIGTTNNPYDTRRTTGGSSGGEASLLACGGSIIGIGSDIAGSLRLPAHNCGVWGHKPSPGIVSIKGHYPDCKNKDVWIQMFTLGPITRYATDLKLLLNVIMKPEKKMMLQLDTQVDVKKIKCFYMDDPKALAATPFDNDVVNAIDKVLAHFDNICDSKCTKVNLPLMKYCLDLTVVHMFVQIQGVDKACDNAYLELLKFLGGQSYRPLNTILYELLTDVLPFIFGKYTKKVNAIITNLRNKFIEILGNDGVFIFPTCATEATYHYTYLTKVSNTGYLSIFNILGFPVTNCPVKFSKNGLPLGVQVVAAPNLDRLTLTVAEEIERAFGGCKFS